MVLTRPLLRKLCRARERLVELGGDDEPLTVDALARDLAISPFHFIRQFEAVFGATPHQFRTRARLERAKQLLASGRSVTEVCMEVGFSSLGSFSDLFRRRIGATPSQYRQRVRRLVQVPGTLPWQLVPGCFSLMGYLPPEAFRSFREA